MTVSIHIDKSRLYSRRDLANTGIKVRTLRAWHEQGRYIVGQKDPHSGYIKYRPEYYLKAFVTARMLEHKRLKGKYAMSLKYLKVDKFVDDINRRLLYGDTFVYFDLVDRLKNGRKCKEIPGDVECLKLHWFMSKEKVLAFSGLELSGFRVEVKR